MKILLPALLLFCASVAVLPAHCQLMKTLDDAHLLQEKDSALFWNKPLKNLLKEIGPEIKMVRGTRLPCLPVC